MITIIRTVIQEYIRNNTLRHFFGISIIIAITSIIATTISLGEGTKIIHDTRINAIEIMGLLSVVIIVAQGRKKACKNHNVHLLLTHYHKKITIYISYLIAYSIILGIFYLMMTTVAHLTISLSGYGTIPGFATAIILSYIKTIGLTTIAWVLGSFMSGYVASILTLFIYFIGHSTGFIAYYFQHQHGGRGATLGKILYYIFPNFQVLDNHIALSSQSPSLDIAIGIGIMIAYSVIITTIGVIITRKQEI